MLDLRKIRDNPDLFREKLARRNSGDEKAVAQILALDEEIRKLKQHGESLKSERNKASKEIGAIKAKGGDIAEASAKV
jgi:seryl-tRNA synthetase